MHPDLAPIWDRAVDRHGEDALRATFPHVATPAGLRAVPDDRVLSAMTSRVFSAGFRWSVVQKKWDGFEAAFDGFDPAVVADYDATDIERLASDTRIVRNRPKIVSTIDNARFVQAVAAEHGSFGAFLAGWPVDDPVGLWEHLKKHGSRLGGNTGQFFLRAVGFDTFRLSGDVGQALVDAGVVAKAPTGKRAQRAAQEAIVAWARASDLSLGAVSMVLARSTGAVYDRTH